MSAPDRDPTHERMIREVEQEIDQLNRRLEELLDEAGQVDEQITAKRALLHHLKKPVEPISPREIRSHLRSV